MFEMRYDAQRQILCSADGEQHRRLLPRSGRFATRATANPTAAEVVMDRVKNGNVVGTQRDRESSPSTPISAADTEKEAPLAVGQPGEVVPERLAVAECLRLYDV